MNKSANQLYKESGSSLPFNVWLEREKKKDANFMADTQANQEFNATLNADGANSSPKVSLRNGIIVFVVSTAAVLALVALIKKTGKKE